MSKPYVRNSVVLLLVLLGMVSGAWAYHIGDFVWLDTNRNGIQDAGEMGVEGIVVNVYRCADDVLIGTAITDAAGWYEVLMGYSTPAPFYVQFVLPVDSPYAFTLADQGSDDALDSDPDANGFTACFTWPLPYYPEPGYIVTIPDFDAGLVEEETPLEIRIGDYVWFDADKDGIQDATETGVAGVDVNVYRCADDLLIGTAATDAAGRYEVFLGTSVPEPFYVKFILPADSPFAFTLQNQGADDALDSDANAGGVTACFTWPAPDPDAIVNIPDFDAGLVEVPCVGTGTPGYWMNHPEAWPVEQITIGGVIYSKAAAIKWMKKPVSKDMTVALFPALVSAKLNVLNGTNDTCIADTIQAADAWMAIHPVGSGVKAKSADWKQISDEFSDLDDYNNGLLCAPHRDSLVCNF
jgi:hypothetical protein